MYKTLATTAQTTLVATIMFASVFGTVQIAFADGFGDSDGWYDSGSSDSWYDSGSSDSWYDSGSSDSWYDSGSSDTWTDAGGDSDSWYTDGSSDTWADLGVSDAWYDNAASDVWTNTGDTDAWYNQSESDTWSNLAESDTWTNVNESDTWTNVAESDTWTNVNEDGYGVSMGSASYGAASYGAQAYGSYTSARGASYGATGYATSVARPVTTVTPVTTVARVTQVTPQPIVQAQFYPVPSCQLHVTGVNYGGTVSIGYTTTNATQANLSGFGQVAIGSGTRTEANVTTNRTYTMQVNGPGGTSSCAATVSVVAPQPQPVQLPTCTISANPSTINANGYATVTWTSYNATSANLSGVGTVSTAGTTTVYPGTNNGARTYTLTVYNNGRSNTCSTVVGSTYIPVPVPTPIPVPGNLACSISATPNVIANGAAANLTWNSTGAVRAWLSDGLGNVNPSGVLAVRPEASRSYVLTIADFAGRQTTCATNVNVSGAPYVSLSQIPYTGIDFGPFGNAMYWFTLVSLSVVAGYLVVAKRGLLAGSVLGLVGASAHASDPESMILDETIIDEPAYEEAPITPEAPVTTAAPEKVIVTSDITTHDTMQFSTGNDGMPRLIINRS